MKQALLIREYCPITTFLAQQKPGEQLFSSHRLTAFSLFPDQIVLMKTREARASR